MKKFNIIFLSEDMSSYSAASYQNDFVVALQKKNNIFFYGPGYKNYDSNDNIEKIIKKSKFKPEIIFIGHSWLKDKADEDVDIHKNINLKNTNIFKVFFLNKEYVNLDEKINYIKSNEFNLCLTHHHDINLLKSRTDCKFLFVPFAFDQNRFGNNQITKNIDIGFSGILQNLNKNSHQSNIRIKIMNIFFKTIINLPIYKRNKYKNLNILWNTIPPQSFSQFISKIFRIYKKIPDEEYSLILSKSKIFINTLSPMNLISPRFFECMASRAIILCEESQIYQKIFPNHICITFKSNMSDFEEKLEFIFNNYAKLYQDTLEIQNYAINNHTWDKRVELVMNKINSLM